MVEETSKQLSERAQVLLKTLVEQFIEDGQPVGSRTLAEAAQLNVSPATIRNVMADLESLGLVTSPHTSAGRVPTIKGYRFFVDRLLSVQTVNQRKVEALKRELEPHQDTTSLVATASEMLSGLTRLAGVVTMPRIQHMALRHVEFLPLSERRVLAILVTNEQEVHNRIIQLHRDFSESELQQVANYLNEKFAGTDINAVRDNILEEMRHARDNMNRLMQQAVEMAEQVFEDGGRETEPLVMAGEVNLMQFQELSNVDKLRALFEAFNQKQEIVHLLDQCLNAEGVQIFIGEESGYTVLGDCSVVTAPYSVDNQVVGVLGVIGPTRMAYDKVIPIVDITAKVLGSALNSKF